ncbi:hypothetical protein DFA_12005 [Cavenderia fasciculata]|uniref:Transmembrane protein n=1 Tax=Cavenderia fasciculata TaxID=261658 RepID=F4QF81_CACFS|nr:uncharacterized protein DFA_12005 [Cavenderia fasciculata]EGG14235.1 hypothetical protein DFA_12005 [Cavenderia fasciculata]|eukprot:XP_004350944.1 hypothetical protein DFA_12005 [Cavenderia fasciculata]
MQSLESFITSPSSLLHGKQQQETSIEFQSLADHPSHHHNHPHNHNHHNHHDHHHHHHPHHHHPHYDHHHHHEDEFPYDNTPNDHGGIELGKGTNRGGGGGVGINIPPIQQQQQQVQQSHPIFNTGRMRTSGPRVVPDVVLTEPPRPTGLLMRFIFLFHPILLFLFVLPGILSFWILFITGVNSVKPYFYIVFLLVPFIFQIILLIYHSRSCLFLSYGRQAVSRKFYNGSPLDDQRYQLVDLHTHSVVALLDKSIQDERAFYLYLPISNQVFNMTYYHTTFRINPIGQWQVIFTWKALLSFLVFGLLITEFILLIALRSWFADLFQ